MQISRGKIKGPQKVVVYGPEGIGKSTFASYFPNPVFIDTEGSTKHMDVARTPKPTSWTMLMQQIQYYKQNPNDFDTLVIDTADWSERLCISHICSKSQKSGIEDFGYGKGYTYLEEEFGRFLNSLEEVIEAGMNVVITAHAWMRKFEQPDEMGGYDRWELKLEKKTAPLLKEWADTVLFANYKTYVINVDGQGVQKGKNKGQGGARVMYTTHHPCWDSKNRWGLASELPFNYKEIAEHIFTRGTTVSQSEKQNVEPQIEKVVNQVPMQKSEQQTPQTEPIKTLQKEVEPQKNNDDLDKLPKALVDLIKPNNVTVDEIRQAVAERGYYTIDTPIENYDQNFINGVLIGAWPQVFGLIKEIRVANESFAPATDEEIPY